MQTDLLTVRVRVRTDLLVVQSDMILDYSSDILESYHGLAICSILTKDYLSFEFYLRAAAYLYGHVKIDKSLGAHYCYTIYSMTGSKMHTYYLGTV